MSPLKNVSVIRKVVQILAFIFFVYGGALGSYFIADKLTRAFPMLTCTYDFKGADYCALIPLQHQMNHRVGMGLMSGTDVWTALTPVFITLGTFLLLFVLLNKAFCGWLCPLGFFQEITHIMGQKLGLKRTESLSESTVKKIRPVKWLMLALLVFGFPLLSGLGFVSHDLGNPYCSICPSRILTTLATGTGKELYVDTSSPIYMTLSVIADFLFGLMIALGLTLRQPFCRICPMLAMHAVFRKLGLLRLVKNSTPRCDRCGLCAKACPMDIREIHTEMLEQDVTYPDCTLCGRCVEFCPDQDVLQLRYLGFPVFSASAEYFKQRKKAQTQWEKATLLPASRGKTVEGAVK